MRLTVTEIRWSANPFYLKSSSFPVLFPLALATKFLEYPTGWTVEEKKDVWELLVRTCAYDDTPTDLLNGWILKCTKAAQFENNPDAVFVLRQYGDIIRQLGGSVMNKPIMEEFCAILRQGDNYKTAMSLRAMLDDLVRYRAEIILDTFRTNPEPFGAIDLYSSFDVFFHKLHLDNDVHLGSDIIVEAERYRFFFWDRQRNKKNASEDPAKVILRKMKCLEDFRETEENDCIQYVLTRTFKFPTEEEALYQYIREFNQKLSEVVGRHLA